MTFIFNSLMFLSWRIRAGTVRRLRDMAGGVLSRVLHYVLADEPIAPLISEPHFEAIDRRLAIVLHTIDSLIRSSSPGEVLVDDGYSWWHMQRLRLLQYRPTSSSHSFFSLGRQCFCWVCLKGGSNWLLNRCYPFELVNQLKCFYQDCSNFIDLIG